MDRDAYWTRRFFLGASDFRGRIWTWCKVFIAAGFISTSCTGSAIYRSWLRNIENTKFKTISLQNTKYIASRCQTHLYRMIHWLSFFWLMEYLLTFIMHRRRHHATCLPMSYRFHLSSLRVLKELARKLVPVFACHFQQLFNSCQIPK